MRYKAKKSDSASEKSTEIKSNLKDNNQFPIEFGFNINRESYTVAGYIVDGIQLRRHPDKDVILDSAIEYLENPSTLAGLIKTDPKCMYEDGGVIISLYILRDIASGPKSEYSKHATRILRAIGRRDLLPKTQRGKHETNKTKSAWMRFWQREPEDLIDTVNEYKNELVELFKACPEYHRTRSGLLKRRFKPRNGSPVYDCCLKYALKVKTGNDSLFEEFNSFMPSTPDLTYVVLLFLHYTRDVPFWELHRYYYKITKNGKLKQRLTPKELVEQKRLEKLQKKSGLKIDVKFNEKPHSPRGKEIEVLKTPWDWIYGIKEKK